MIGVLYSLVPLIAWGTGDYIASKLSKNVNSFVLGFFFSAVGWVAIAPLAIVLGAKMPASEQVVKFLIGSLGVNIGFVLMVRGFQNGPTGIVAPISNAYAIVTAVLSWLLFDQNLSGKSIFGILVVILGIVFVSYAKPKKGEFKNERKALLSSLFALLFFGIGFTFFGEAATGKWYENSFTFQTINLLVGSVMLLLFVKEKRLSLILSLARKKRVYIGGPLGSIGALGLFLALDTIDTVAIPAAIAAAAPLVTALLAYAIDKEHLTYLQRLATLVIVSGIILLAISNG